jgi:hypothetical protein
LTTIGVGAALLLTVVLAATSNLKIRTNSATTDSLTTAKAGHVPSPTAAPVTTAAPSLPGLNQVVRDGGLGFIVNGVQCGVTTLGTDPLMQRAVAGSQWCLVTMTVSNDSSGLQDFFSTYQTAIDRAGHRIEADTSAFFLMPNESQVEDAQLNPGASITATVPFSLATSDSIKRIDVSESASGNGVMVSVS